MPRNLQGISDNDPSGAAVCRSLKVMKNKLIIGGFFAMAIGFSVPVPILLWLGLASVLSAFFMTEPRT
jgi:hypothetical protein